MTCPECQRMREIVDNLEILEIAAIEAFAEGVQKGKPTNAQIEALVDAGGSIRRLLRTNGRGVPTGDGRQTAAYLRELADQCEHDAAQAQEPTP